jgi:hypothetical protein
MSVPVFDPSAGAKLYIILKISKFCLWGHVKYISYSEMPIAMARFTSEREFMKSKRSSMHCSSSE